MLNENIKIIRKQRGFTQEELAIRLHVVRQTVSKWEKGLSVPDADVIQAIAMELDTSVQELLGTKINVVTDTNEIANQLSRINEHMATRNRRSALIWKVIGLILAVALVFAGAYIFSTCRNKPNQLANIKLADTIEIYNISFLKNDNSMEFSFVPSIGNSKLIYKVAIHCISYDIPDQVVIAKYSNGICTVKFSERLVDSWDYNMTLNISNEVNERNVTILTSLSQQKNDFSWSTPWKQ